MRLSQYVLIGLLIVAVLIAASQREKIARAVLQVRGFSDEVRGEMRKVSWPTKDQVISSTIMVGMSTIIFTIFLGFMDLIFGRLVGFIFRA